MNVTSYKLPEACLPHTTQQERIRRSVPASLKIQSVTPRFRSDETATPAKVIWDRDASAVVVEISLTTDLEKVDGDEGGARRKVGTGVGLLSVRKSSTFVSGNLAGIVWRFLEEHVHHCSSIWYLPHILCNASVSG
jgi:hypothetical protein